MASYVPVDLAFVTVEPDGCQKDKAPIIFLHGLTATKENWDDILQITANATKRKVYAVDARNHGDSAWNDNFNFDIIVDDLLHFMDKHNIPKALLVGHSMGGITAIKAALKAPDRIEKFVAEDISARVVPQPILSMVATFVSLAKASLAHIPPNADEETAKKFIIEFVMKSLPPEIQKPITPRDTDYRMQLKKTPDGKWRFKSNIEILEKAITTDAKDLMSEPSGLFDKPSCFIYGKLSPFLVGLDEPFIKKFFPNSEFVGIDNATHTVHTDQPKEFTEALLNFLQKE